MRAPARRSRGRSQTARPTGCETAPHYRTSTARNAAARIAAFLADHLSWSAFWDKREGVWRVSENDPDSELYAVSRDADTVIRYMTANS